MAPDPPSMPSRQSDELSRGHGPPIEGQWRGMLVTGPESRSDWQTRTLSLEGQTRAPRVHRPVSVG